MFRKISAVIIAAAIAAGAITAYAANFADIENSRYKNEIRYLNEYGIIIGDEKGNANPDAYATRAEFAAMLSRALGYEKRLSLRQSIATSYPDFTAVPEWAKQGFNDLLALGILSDIDGNLVPSGTVAARKAASVVGVALSLSMEGEIPENYPESVRALTALSERGALEGIADLNAPITRGALARMIAIAFGIIVNADYDGANDYKTTIVVTVPNVVIKNITVDDLVITEAAGEGTITLENVKINKKLTVRGSGTVVFANNTAVLGKVSVSSLLHSVKIKNLTENLVNMTEILSESEPVVVNGKLNDIVLGERVVISTDAADIDTITAMFDDSQIFISANSHVRQIIVIGENVQIFFEEGGKADVIDSQSAGTTVIGKPEFSQIIGDVFDSSGNRITSSAQSTPSPTYLPVSSPLPAPPYYIPPTVTAEPTTSPESTAIPESTASPESTTTPEPTASTEPTATPEPNGDEIIVVPEYPNIESPMQTESPTPTPTASATSTPTTSPLPTEIPPVLVSISINGGEAFLAESSTNAESAEMGDIYFATRAGAAIGIPSADLSVSVGASMTFAVTDGTTPNDSDYSEKLPAIDNDDVIFIKVSSGDSTSYYKLRAHIGATVATEKALLQAIQNEMLDIIVVADITVKSALTVPNGINIKIDKGNTLRIKKDTEFLLDGNMTVAGALLIESGATGSFNGTITVDSGGIITDANTDGTWIRHPQMNNSKIIYKAGATGLIGKGKELSYVKYVGANSVFNVTEGQIEFDYSGITVPDDSAVSLERDFTLWNGVNFNVNGNATVKSGVSFWGISTEPPALIRVGTNGSFVSNSVNTTFSNSSNAAANTSYYYGSTTWIPYYN